MVTNLINKYLGRQCKCLSLERFQNGLEAYTKFSKIQK